MPYRFTGICLRLFSRVVARSLGAEYLTVVIIGVRSNDL